jgi:hypothetical protein
MPLLGLRECQICIHYQMTFTFNEIGLGLHSLVSGLRRFEHLVWLLVRLNHVLAHVKVVADDRLVPVVDQ